MNQRFFKPGQGEKPVSAAYAELEVEGLGKFSIGQVATVGRSAESQVTLNLPSISRNHARIFYEGGHYWIKDLDSANGISINGKRVKLQMLSDQDRICFGEANAVFRTADQAVGPASLGQDPLAGAETAMPDGTPTGGLDGLNQVRDLNLAGSADVGGTQSAYPRDAEVEPLTSRIENLQAENDRLRRELTENRSASTGPAGAAVLTSEQAEIERLRTLVSRLERALADSNLRFRNLQQKLDESK